jgi:hypothetical protein
MQLCYGESVVWAIPESPHQHDHPQKPVCWALFSPSLQSSMIFRGSESSVEGSLFTCCHFAGQIIKDKIGNILKKFC